MRWPADRLDVDAYPGPGFDLPVFYGDLDTNRHMNNVALGRYFEQGRVQTHRAVGINRAARTHGSSLLVARVAIDYLGEIHYSVGPLHIRTRVIAIGRSSVTEEQAAWQDGTCVALAEAVAAYRLNGEAAPWPDDVREKFAALQMPLR